MSDQEINQQDEVRERIKQWWKDGSGAACGPAEYYLSGFAGVGKTWTAAHLPGDLGLPAAMEGGVRYAAYTGKAASVLASKGCTGASTLHSLIYLPQAKGREELRNLKAELDAMGDVGASGNKQRTEAKRLQKRIDKLELDLSQPGFILNEESELCQTRLLIVDEVSMVSQDMAEDLRSFDVRMIVMGDPAQLPPVGGRAAFDQDPDYLMTQIRRQAEGSPILSLATCAREGRPIKPARVGDVMAYKPLQKYRMAEYDQVLCGRNTTRQKLNQAIRRLHKVKSWVPEPGDKIIVLENNKDWQVLNGHMFTVTEAAVREEQSSVALKVLDDEGRERALDCWSDPFERFQEGEDGIKKMDYGARQRKVFATFGHAITVHKSQGSQWPRVLLVDESRVFRTDAAKWLYTGITRAAEGLAIVRANDVL